jgi:beta-glucosidase
LKDNPMPIPSSAHVILFLLAFGVLPALAQSRSSPSKKPDERVESILGRMTLAEKIDLIGGVDGFFIRSIERLGLPRLKMADGPIGVRNYGPATAMAGGIALAATWNPSLAERVGIQIGRDARAKGVHFLLGPGANIYRAPMNGRNFEYLGEDPFLASRIAVGYVKGVQSQGVSATIKHFMGNNSEFDRHNIDCIIDERTMREVYLPVFEAAVKEAHVGAIMDSYNLTNGEHLTQNGYLNTDVAKKNWGFDGIIMSDWGATYDAVAAANGGMDLEMPAGVHFTRDSLLPAIHQGKVSVATIDDKVRRILHTAVRFGWLDHDQTDLSIPRYNQEGRQVALQAAREGMVLLKNDSNLLPLNKQKIKTIAVVGPDAYPAVPVGGGSARVEPFAAISFLEGISNALATTGKVYYHRGLPTLNELAEATNFLTSDTGGEAGLHAEYFTNTELQGTSQVTRIDPHLNFGFGSRASFPEGTRSCRWTGYYLPSAAGAYDVFVESSGEGAGSYRLYVDEKLVLDNWTSVRALANHVTFSFDKKPHKIMLVHRQQWSAPWARLRLGVIPHGKVVSADAKKLASNADVVVVAVGFDPETESEGADRTFRLPPGQDELIQDMAAANKNTIVVITSGGGVGMDAWLDRVPAVIEAWYPGQEGGTALAEILFGDVNPSGRLPVTFEHRWEDNPVHDSYYPEEGTNRVEYKEGVFVGYRGYEHKGTKPLFPFGYGLSYTTFEYSNLSITPIISKETQHESSLPRYEVSFDMKNTGNREGEDVAQVYVGETHGSVPRPLKELKGLAKVQLRPGETKSVSMVLDNRAFSYYDVAQKQWHVGLGEFDILIGRSSEQIVLRAKLSLK